MAKAFSEKEKIEIKEKILETSLDLFHENGRKSLSIKELTSRVGIAQGSFYNFWQDKESLIMDLIAYRSAQKLTLLKNAFPNSLENPHQFLTDIIFNYSINLMEKVKTKKAYEDAFKIFYEKNKGEMNYVKQLYLEFIIDLTSYWKNKKVIREADENGLLNAFLGAFIICLNSNQFDKEYFNEMLRLYINSIVNTYLTV